MPGNQVGEREGHHHSGLDAAVVAEQIRLLVHKRLDLPVHLLNACIVSVALWPLYPVWVVIVWLGLFCVVISARSLIRRRYLIEAPSVEEAQRWGRIFAWNAFAAGCLWGLTASVILVTPNPLYHVFIVFVLGGMMAGGIVSNAASMPAMVAFMLPTILPVIAALVSRGSPLRPGGAACCLHRRAYSCRPQYQPINHRKLPPADRARHIVRQTTCQRGRDG